MQGSFVYAPSQWETTLRRNVVSHWLGACTKLSWHMTLPPHLFAMQRNTQRDSPHKGPVIQRFGVFLIVPLKSNRLNSRSLGEIRSFTMHVTSLCSVPTTNRSIHFRKRNHENTSYVYFCQNVNVNNSQSFNSLPQISTIHKLLMHNINIALPITKLNAIWLFTLVLMAHIWMGKLGTR